MQEDIIIVPIVFLTFLAGFWFYISSRNKERMSMIERGITPSAFLSRQRLNPGDPLNMLKWGLLIFGVGLGFLVDVFLDSIPGYDVSHELKPALMLVGGGAGLLVYYLIASKTMKQREEKEIK